MLVPAVAATLFANAVVTRSAMVVPVRVVTVVALWDNVGPVLTLAGDDNHLTVTLSHHWLAVAHRRLYVDSHLRLAHLRLHINLLLGIGLHMGLLHWHSLHVRLLLRINSGLLVAGLLRWVLTRRMLAGRVHARLTRRVLTRRVHAWLTRRVLSRIWLLAGVARLHFLSFIFN